MFAAREKQMFFAEFSFSSKDSFLPFCSEKNIPIILFVYTPFSCCVFSFFVGILFLFVDTVLSFCLWLIAKLGIRDNCRDNMTMF